ncbi:MAG: haloacid dehalogenase-like hydrolase [Myxococcales bacterium]|nr:haloacid dehalogenase-like hydrolase [Myxococcales bacterium]
MKSYRELAPLAPSLRGIFCDVDDTLTHAGSLVPAAYEAIVRATDAGLRVVAVTGRPAGWAEVLASTWPLAGAIGENGAFAVRRAPTGKGVERLTWDDAATCSAQGRRLSQIADEIIRDIPGARLADDQWLRRCDLAFDIGETQQLPAATVDAICDRIRAAGARCITSSVHAHAFFGDHDKARMCARVARAWWDEDLEATRGDWLFVGDSPNDQSCFAWFPVAAGVANVRRYLDRLAPPPAYVAEAEGGHGFAQIVELLLSAR